MNNLPVPRFPCYWRIPEEIQIEKPSNHHTSHTAYFSSPVVCLFYILPIVVYINGDSSLFHWWPYSWTTVVYVNTAGQNSFRRSCCEIYIHKFPRSRIIRNALCIYTKMISTAYLEWLIRPIASGGTFPQPAAGNLLTIWLRIITLVIILSPLGQFSSRKPPQLDGLLMTTTLKVPVYVLGVCWAHARLDNIGAAADNDDKHRTGD